MDQVLCNEDPADTIGKRDARISPSSPERETRVIEVNQALKSV
jgi:hypothetical protein